MYHIEILLILIIVAVSKTTDLPKIEITNGIVQGTLQKSYNGRTFSSFEGIPYAKPPLGDLRFEPAQEPYNWTGTWIADTQHSCMQNIFNNDTIIGTEDCLYVNVYVPREMPNTSDNMNVIVHIHGGAFMFGSGHFYSGPKYLMDEDVVFVTMNFRLGAFGFLSTGDEVVPGNNGMKDQVLALSWIQKNIKYFGGNPGSVTITGLSSGGGSVHLHYFSPLSKGLFHRGVSQSGTALNPWAIQEFVLERSKNLANILGCPKHNSRDMVNCLKSRSGGQIVEAVNRLYVFDGFPAVLFGPVIEQKYDDKSFLIESPYKILKDKRVLDVPWIVSVTAVEGDFVARAFSADITKCIKIFKEIASYLLIFRDDLPNKDYIIEQIREKYFKEPKDFQNLVKVIGHRYFLAGSGQAARLQAKANKSPVYFYIFDYRGESSFFEHFHSGASDIGVSHGDDILYYLHSSKYREPLSPGDDKMRSIFLKLLTSYANNGEPKVNGATWNAVTGKEDMEYLHFKGPHDIYPYTIRDMGFNSFWSQLPLRDTPFEDSGKDEL